MNNLFYGDKYALISKFRQGKQSEIDFFNYHDGHLSKSAFELKQKELEEDFVYKGCVILNSNLKVNFQKLFEIKPKQNELYVHNFKSSPYMIDCSVDDTILYCDSFTFWIVGQYQRFNGRLYDACRVHRIKFRRLGDGILR